MSYVAGLNTTIAINIVEYRKEKQFASRAELLKVSKLGPKAYEQCAGFLRLTGSSEVLDATGVHPESYEATKKLLAKYGYTEEDVRNNNLGDLKNKVARDGAAAVAAEIGVGEMTLNDIVDEILKPGRDIRDSLTPPVLRADLMDIKDLKEGMELTGVVRNVIDFGAFIDIGVHHDGLCHISEISDRYIKHPSEALKVGETVKVKVIGVDLAKNRINLSIKGASGYVSQKAEADRPKREKREFADKKPSDKQNKGNFKANGERRDKNGRNSGDLESMLKALQNKFNRK